jgi:hypothetical protein
MQCASIAHECSLASSPSRVKRVPSRELREWHGGRRNGLERRREMIEHRVRLAAKASPHADRCRSRDESIGIGA